jgi:hypothetical protein
METPAPEWTALDDEALLERRIRSFGLQLEGSELERYVRQLHDELAAKGLAFLPRCHVGDEWFVPVGIPAIFVPFFLVHERLRRLERKMMLEVEGETPEWFMQLMRHEAAHAYSYAFRLQRRRQWQQTFGLASTEESDFYRPRPYSRSYVIHLDDWYAQAHPDEDWAETFAVWLTPGLDWRERYRDWKALQKLEYVDTLMRSLAGQPARHNPDFAVADYDCLDVRLKTYYARKRELFAESYPDFYDNDLRRLFPLPAAGVVTMPASRYLRRQRRTLLEAVCRWSNERKFRVHGLLDRLVRRCDELKLTVAADEPGTRAVQVAAFVTTLVMNYLFTGRFKRTK